jgi:hypothetical protein
MNWFQKLHDHKYPPGLERRIWRKLPLALLASIAIPAGLSIGTRLSPPDGSIYEVARTTASVDIFAIALLLTAVTAVVTVGIGCIVVMIMKGPAYVADGDRPGTRVPLEPDC